MGAKEWLSSNRACHLMETTVDAAIFAVCDSSRPWWMDKVSPDRRFYLNVIHPFTCKVCRPVYDFLYFFIGMSVYDALRVHEDPNLTHLEGKALERVLEGNLHPLEELALAAEHRSQTLG